jgi:hypothetical protein
MTPKEKARELFDKYNFLKEIFIPSINEQKQCALIAVDEILKQCYAALESYWYEVQQEIEKL